MVFIVLILFLRFVGIKIRFSFRDVGHSFSGLLRTHVRSQIYYRIKYLASNLQNLKTFSHHNWPPVSREIMLHFVKYLASNLV